MSELPARPGRLNGLRHIALLVPNLEVRTLLCRCAGHGSAERANEDLVPHLR
jgi:hypothetical protein